MKNKYNLEVMEKEINKKIEKEDYFLEDNNLINSSVENIFILDCSLNAFSSDQMAQFKERANAKYGSSFLESSCGDNECASDKYLIYSSFENESIFDSIIERRKANICSLILPYFKTLSLSDINSSKAYLGTTKRVPLCGNSSIILLLSEPILKNEKRIEASTTSVKGSLFIITASYKSCLLATLSFSSEPNCDANSSVILEFFNNSSATLNISFSASRSLSALETKATTSSLVNSLNPNFNSSGIFILMNVSSIRNDNIDEYINFSSFSLRKMDVCFLCAELLAIIELNYTDASDTALIDLLVEDPASEPAGQKLSTVTFTASLGE
ncbi:MAG: hypothetical protein AABW75_01680 [Nanoarchaeota archaeon]